MSYFDLLPSEICDYIYSIKSANTIIDYWYLHIQKKVLLINQILYINSFNPWNIRHSTLFNDAARILSGKEDYDWWTNIIIKFAMSINYCPISDRIMDRIHSSNYTNLNIYNLSICSCIMLSHKFNIYNLVNNILFIL